MEPLETLELSINKLDQNIKVFTLKKKDYTLSIEKSKRTYSEIKNQVLEMRESLEHLNVLIHKCGEKKVLNGKI